MPLDIISYKPSQMLAWLDRVITSGRPGMIHGSPGVGKSDVVRQCAEDRGLALRDVRLAHFDPTDLRGMPVLDREKRLTTWFPPDFLPTKGKGILFLDELPNAPQLVQAAAYQLVLDRQLGDYRLPDGWHIIAAGNYDTDRAATHRMPTPLRSRFLHAHFAVDAQDWLTWAAVNGIDPMILGWIAMRGDALHVFDPKSAEHAFPCPRTWHYLSDLLATDLPRDIEMGAIAGTVGTGMAVEFSGFIRHYRELPAFADIMARPATTHVPASVDARFAVAAGLAHAATKANIGKVITYMERMPPEYAVFCIRTAKVRDASICQSSAFVSWAVDKVALLT